MWNKRRGINKERGSHMYYQDYLKQVGNTLALIQEQEGEKIQQAAGILAETLKQDGLLYVFGCGHSHMLAEELFYRAGGLAAVYPIFETSAMLHEGAAKSSRIERMSGYAPYVMDRYPISKKDCLLLSSTSGINPFSMEMAECASAKGAKVIGISSFAYLEKPSRRADGKHLPDVCDLCIDNHVPVGDAVIQVREDGTKAGPLSTIATLAIANSITLTACELLKAQGIEPQVFRSGNCPGTDEYNAQILDTYMPRVRHL